MTATAIRCEACDDTGSMTAWEDGLGHHTIICPICGSKVESSPHDHDIRARQAIEGMESSSE